MERGNMAEKVKNEHYVPQRYLKHFANGENFFVFDKEKADKLCEASHNSSYEKLCIM